MPDAGDPHLRLEKYLLRQVSREVDSLKSILRSFSMQYERVADWAAIDAFLAALVQSYPTSAMVFITRTDYLL